ncbi:serine/threonine protein kinase [Alloactinosynnema sp. L-07]|uniref:serine/threonine-protein kinase n=1 Tax=Alloactinosynnema sp. L-07 TaxID=1653480 RepID=UPI00065EF714|nr:serine/threonine-protein kinase [Alloactinosynnema sp. L-07]CRK55123.1 serine/threonine protein kinase [Alloactinosynnema sp. L-07]
MTACSRFGCAGTIDETGYCDACGHPPSSPPTDLAQSTRSESTASRRARDGAVPSLPVFDYPDPSSRILREFQVPDRARRCANPDCADRRKLPPQPSGFCLACGTAFSFLPSLDNEVVVGDQYRVEGVLARGGLGWIYLAHDTRLDDNRVVLKGLIDVGDADIATAERQALTTIDHPNIVRIFNFVSHPDPRSGTRAYIVMEYVDGFPLSEVAYKSRHGEKPPLGEPLLIEHVITCGLQVLAAFEYLHERGLLYCDLKPDNVIIRSGKYGERDNRIKLIDLGAVRRMDDRISPIIGTVGYQVSKAEIDERGLTVASEIHTVGETLHQLYLATADRTGHHGADADQRRIAVGVESFKRVCARAKHADPDRRFASAADMAEQLRGVLREIAALRDGRPRPGQSELFHPSAALLDDGLGAVPPLHRWIDRPADVPLTDLPLDDGMPTPAAVAVGLPAPRPFADDPAAAFLTTAAADFLADGGADAAHRLLAKLAQAELRTVEAGFARCRAALAAGDSKAAADGLAQARELLGATEDWRLHWHDGLVSLMGEDFAAAEKSFDTVYAALPGEDAPKLALAYCAEYEGRLEQAEAFYLAVWRRDRSAASAAFGIARGHLARDERERAVALLDETPAMSRHFDAARIATVRVLSGYLDGDRPSADDLRAAADRLGGLYLDGGAKTGQSRTRLDTVVLEARLGATAGGAGEDGLRSRLEECYRALARQSETRDHHSDLVDLANEHRPFTFT